MCSNIFNRYVSWCVYSIRVGIRSRKMEYFVLCSKLLALFIVLRAIVRIGYVDKEVVKNYTAKANANNKGKIVVDILLSWVIFISSIVVLFYIV